MSKAQELARMLDRMSERAQVGADHKAFAEEHGLLIVHGYSDDGIEFHGAFEDEGDCYGGGHFRLWREGLYKSQCDCEDCPHERLIERSLPLISAVWGDVTALWTYQTNLEHETFLIVDEDGDPFCIGLVLPVAQLPSREDFDD